MQGSPATADLAGRVVVVIGGTSGIGRATAELAASKGAAVHLTGRSPERAEAVAGEIGRSATGAALDLRDADSIAAFFDTLERVDHITTPAAALSYAPFAEFDVEVAREIFDVKVFGVWRALQTALPLMVAGGSAVLVGGLAVDRPGKGTAAVSAANGAVVTLARALAVELAPVRVNAVSPGVTDTPGWDFMPEDERRDFLNDVAGSLPVGRVGASEDAAAAIVYLMSAGFVTGETLHVDGGGRLV
ncbi:SDR family oxidoreductase [Thermoleophilia bacterium SCSIO 60948]|nr:SDR family oxidoreductase [Thermoleophilia bacterium SCSIO 60948]